MANSTTQFGGFLTNVGIAQQANTAALGLPWNITHMLIGDAGGEPSQTPDPTPKPTQNALVRQVYRAQLNALYQSPADPGVLVAELVLRPETGGWWIRELALEDANGNFIAVAKPAPSYKPLLAQGSGRTQTIRMHVVFGNLANVTLKIDPSIVLATRDYVDKAREAAELYARNQLKAHVEAADPHPQYLRRADVAKDAGPLAWLGAAGGTADALVLTLKSSEAALPAYAAGQRFQFQAVATNTGAVTARINGRPAVAVKKAGTGGLVDLVGGDVRAGALYDLNYDGTYFQLGGGVSSGRAFERFSFAASLGQTVFNAPHSIGSTVVLRNGREVTDYLADGQKITFRAPCGMGEAVEILAFGTFQAVDTYTKAEMDMLVKTASALPVGTMLPFPKSTVPLGFLEIDGSAQSAACYPDLAAYLGSTFNTGTEEAGFFRLPDSRGEFLRGWDHGRGIDPGRTLGSAQLDQMQRITGRLDNINSGTAFGAGEGALKKSGSNVQSHTTSGGGSWPKDLEFDSAASPGARTGSETRSRNLAVMWCIKAWSAPVNQGSIDVAALAAQAATAMPKHYHSGLGMSVNAGAPASTIDVAPGLARGLGRSVELSSIISGVLQASGGWSAGTAGRKLDTGARTANSWYHVFILRHVESGEPDLLFSLSLEPNVPPGYETIRRTGSILTGATGEVVPFIDVGRERFWSAPVKEGAGSFAATGAVTQALTLTVPRGVRVMVKLQIAYAGAAINLYLRPTDSQSMNISYIPDVTAAALAGWNVGMTMNTYTTEQSSQAFDVLTDLSAAIVMQAYALQGLYSITNLGYTELL